MPKTLRDWVALLSILGSLISFVLGNVVPPAWRQGITAWQVVFLLCLLYLAGWAVDHYLIAPIKELRAAILKLEKATTELTCTVGSQHNRVEELVGKTNGIFSSMYKITQDLPSIIRDSISKTGMANKSVENSK